MAVQRATLALALAVVAVTTVLVPGPAAASATAPGDGGQPALDGSPGDGATSPSLDGALAQLDYDPDSTEIRIALASDGDARWTVRYGLRLDDQNDTEAFRRLQEDVAANTSAYLADFRTGISATVADAESATGREMTATNFSVATSYDSIQQRGYVTYSFTWRGFADREGDRLLAGDALAGFFLDADTTMVVSWPEAYSLVSAEPAATASGNAVTWSGERTTFDASGPRVVVTRGGSPPWLLVGGAVLALAVLAAGAFYWRRERSADDGPVEAPEPAASAGGSGSEVTDDGAGESGAEPPPELLSNEERVLRFLEERGGRAKQQDLVSELDWTAAKTSQVVNGMQDEGAIEKFRLGRENVLVLPEEADDVVGGDEE